MIWSVIGLCTVAGIVVVFLKDYRPEFALLVSAAAGVFSLMLLLQPALEIIAEIKGRMETSGLTSVFSVLLKTVGICYITDFAADLCRDFGQNSLAAKVETAGKLSIVLVCLPLVASVLKITDKLIG